MPTLSCPLCGAADPSISEGGLLTCSACGAEAELEPFACPACGYRIARFSDACPQCREPLTSFGQVVARHMGTRADPVWLQRTRMQAPAIKEHERQSSERRMQSLVDVDRERLDQERQAYADKDRAERKMSILLFASLGAFLLILCVWAVMQLVP